MTFAHHEPALHKRFEDTMRAIGFVVQHLETTPLSHRKKTFDP
jgi:hypothetical protein